MDPHKMNGQKLILLAEDSRDDAFFLRRAFMAAGSSCSIVDVRNGQQAINYLSGTQLYTDRSTFPLPQVVILDLKMPMVNGFEVLAWMRAQQNLSGIPVIVLSSSNLEIDKAKAQELGAQDYLVKPTDPGDFIQMVQGLQERWLKNGQVSGDNPNSKEISRFQS